MSNARPRHPPGVATARPGRRSSPRTTVMSSSLGRARCVTTAVAVIATIAIAFGLALTSDRHQPRPAARGRRDRIPPDRRRRRLGQRLGRLAAARPARRRRAPRRDHDARHAWWRPRRLVARRPRDRSAIVAGLMEPVQQRIVLFQDRDLVLAALLYGAYVSWIALVVASVIRARAGGDASAGAVRFRSSGRRRRLIDLSSPRSRPGTTRPASRSIGTGSRPCRSGRARRRGSGLSRSGSPRPAGTPREFGDISNVNEKIRWRPYSQSRDVPDEMYRSLACCGLVAVRLRHRLAHRDERLEVLRGHVGRQVGERVAVRPHHEPAGRVEADRGTDLLAAADDAAVDEVAEGPRLGRRERARPAVARVGRASCSHRRSSPSGSRSCG